jgi:RNA recognition motif-containing protein
MAKKLFVGSLPYSTTEEDLQKLFEQYGTVESAVIIMDRATNRSKGFGFVEMSTEDEAQAAIDGLNETEIEGRKIIVNIARPKEN